MRTTDEARVWVKTLKVGDVVVLIRGTRGVRAEVVRITPSGRFTARAAKVGDVPFGPDAMEWGSTFFGWTAYEATPERLARAEEEEATAKALRVINAGGRCWEDLPTEVLVEVAAVLERHHAARAGRGC